MSCAFPTIKLFLGTSVNRFVTKGGFESSRFYKRPSDTLLPDGYVSYRIQTELGYAFAPCSLGNTQHDYN